MNVVTDSLVIALEKAFASRKKERKAAVGGSIPGNPNELELLLQPVRVK